MTGARSLIGFDWQDDRLVGLEIADASRPRTAARSCWSRSRQAGTAHVILGVVDWGAVCSHPLAATYLKVYAPGQFSYHLTPFSVLRAGLDAVGLYRDGSLPPSGLFPAPGLDSAKQARPGRHQRSARL